MNSALSAYGPVGSLEVELLERLQGAALRIKSWHSAVEVGQHDAIHPALLLPLAFGLGEFGDFVADRLQPLARDQIHLADGLLAIQPGREVLKQLVVGVDRLGILRLPTQAFRLVEAGPLGDFRAVLGVVRDLLEHVAGLGELFAPVRVLRRGQALVLDR